MKIFKRAVYGPGHVICANCGQGPMDHLGDPLVCNIPEQASGGWLVGYICYSVILEPGFFNIYKYNAWRKRRELLHEV